MTRNQQNNAESVLLLQSTEINHACLQQLHTLYSIPHLSFTITGFPVSPLKNGLGLSGRALDIVLGEQNLEKKLKANRKPPLFKSSSAKA